MLRRVGCALLAAVVLVGPARVQAAEPPLIPWPAQVVPSSDSFAVDAETAVCATGGAAGKVAQRLRDTLKAVRGLELGARSCEGGIGITLTLSTSAPVADPEGYTLDVGRTGIRILARGQAGLYYGAMTLVQLLSGGLGHSPRVELAGVHIEDAPRFKWRGVMLDPSRHFLPVGAIETMLEQMGQHKLNFLHLHLTDDQGWRIQVKRYPRLTQVGAWRTPPSNGGPGSETGVYGGFYTQEDIRHIVAYATERYITVVPEIDVPGHAQAVVAAYPELGVTGRQVAVSGDWGVNHCLYNTSAAGLTFLENVLDEVMALFPSRYVHLGGDEAVKDEWEASPVIQSQMRSLGLSDVEALQGWFMGQVGTYLSRHGRILVGWDEILQGGVPEDATVMSWRGIQGAITAARRGHDVVLSPAPTLYFDNLQSRRDDEPAGRLNVATLVQVYSFDPVPSVLTPEEGRHVLGAQANFWSEYLTSGWSVQHAAFPRLGALSEAVWSRASQRSWAGFLGRLPAQMQRYRQQGIAAADSAFAVDFQLPEGRNAALREGTAAVVLTNQTDFGRIYYTLDGSDPGLHSQVYTAPLSLKLGTVVKAAAFDAEGLPLAAERRYEFSAETLRSRSSNQLEACPGADLKLRLPLTPDSTAIGPAYDVDLYHGCYIYPKALLDGVGGLQLDLARLARNFALANHKGEVQSLPARTRFGEVVVYRDRCDTGPELARVVLPDPAVTEARWTASAGIAPVGGEHDLCLQFAVPADGPLYGVGEVRLVTR